MIGFEANKLLVGKAKIKVKWQNDLIALVEFRKGDGDENSQFCPQSLLRTKNVLLNYSIWLYLLLYFKLDCHDISQSYSPIIFAPS